MLNITFSHVAMMVLFACGYIAIALEHILKVNKTAVALLMAVGCWITYFVGISLDTTCCADLLGHYLSSESQVVFFLLGAMALVELIDGHGGFYRISHFMRTHSKVRMMWIASFVAFFLSAVIDNLTATIVMISIIRRLVAEREDRLLLGSMVVIAANAGGAWTPIGDVTTTMLWIAGRVTPIPLMTKLILPSLACLVVSVLFSSRKMVGEFAPITYDNKPASEPFANAVLILGIGALLAVPLFKAAIGLPPFMGMLLGLGSLWLATDIFHGNYEERERLRVPHVLSRIDNAGILFFLGILLAVDALEASSILMGAANYFDKTIHNTSVIAVLIGLISSVIDNVPLVAAAIGMYSLAAFPGDSQLWQLVAFCAGTGGSILIIGSAAGIAFMGLEKVDFLWYVRKISLSALAGYAAGIAVYLVQAALFS